MIRLNLLTISTVIAAGLVLAAWLAWEVVWGVVG